MKKNNYILSFIITFIILFLVYYILGYFSITTLLTSDLAAQYYPFLYFLKGILDGTNNLFYTFQIGIGTCFYDIFLYYLVPLSNLLIKFISYENLYIFIVFTILIKISLCGLTMCIYLNYHFKKNNFNIFFSICYALSSAIIANYLQIMWLDAYFLSPLVLLGIDKIINEDKPLLYGITLFLVIFTNYYMGYLICFYSVLYFFYKLSFKKDSKLKVIKTFFITSFLAGLMTMCTNFTGLVNILNTNKNFEFNFNFSSNPISFFSSFFMWNNHNESVLNYTVPRMYISMFLFILLFFYFINKKINKKEKKKTTIFLFIMVLFIFLEPLNTFWHAFSIPTGYKFRFVYLIDIFIITICYKSFENIKFIDKKYYFLALYLIFVLAFCCIFSDYINMNYIYLSLFFVILYLVLMYFKKMSILYLVLMIELFLNGLLYYKCIPTMVDENLYYNKNLGEIFNIITKDEKQFYRMDFSKLDDIEFNENLFYGYRGATTFVSTISYDMYNFFNKIGYYMKSNNYSFENYEIINSILGIKYYADKNSKDELLGNYGENKIYKNNNALNLGFFVSSNAKNSLDCSSVFECQQYVLNSMNNTNEQFFIEIPIEKINQYEYKIKNLNNESKYLNIYFEYEDSAIFEIYLDDKLSGTFSRSKGDVIGTSAILKDIYDGDITLRINDKNNTLKNIKLYAYNFNYDLYEQEIKKLQSNQIKITEFNENYIKGNVEGAGTMFFSIPYSEYWNIYIDGTKVETVKLFDAFLGVDIPDGEHTIELVYKIDTFKYGITISIISTIIFVFYNYKKHCFKK